ncbi:hypothetical protein Pcinc_009005 [Petrolisthes cinctipes]|uniref:Uncharacterized protein n=1 Tax=Petrolisthes cinctipes TaxID=88211 RepID=A0AAE1GC58_PETCI|nr:hypothetical protein Pcinc_009005 [Petrolisthes cinctipes]
MSIHSLPHPRRHQQGTPFLPSSFTLFIHARPYYSSLHSLPQSTLPSFLTLNHSTSFHVCLRHSNHTHSSFLKTFYNLSLLGPIRHSIHIHSYHSHTIPLPYSLDRATRKPSPASSHICPLPHWGATDGWQGQCSAHSRRDTGRRHCQKLKTRS